MSEMTAEEYAAAQIAEYAKYTADGPIDIDRVRAFGDGDPVPIGHVEGYDAPEVVDGTPTGKTVRVEPVVRLDQVKKVPAAKKTAPAATKES
jgi:hypothetical protein